MSRAVAVLLVALVVPAFAAPRRDGPAAAGPDGVPVGKWRVEFANGVVETCTFADGKVTEMEPLRRSTGKPAVQDGSAVIAFEDDRTERWTVVGDQWVVEHWCPSAAHPAGRPVVGIAKRQR
jgi:hypothetical protein